MNAIKGAKEAAWAELCSLVDGDPWGRPYRLVMPRLAARRPIPGINTPGRIDSVVDGLFPVHPPKQKKECPANEPIVPVTETEFQKLALAIPENKAPGLDKIPEEAVKLLVKVFNKCLQHTVFPAEWKRAQLVLLRETDRPLEEPSTYRPLCMLDAVGKHLEKVIDVRLKTIYDEKCLMTANQYGFRRGKSTLDAISHIMQVIREGAESKDMVVILLLDVEMPSTLHPGGLWLIRSARRLSQALYAKSWMITSIIGHCITTPGMETEPDS